MITDNVAGLLEEPGRQLIQDLSFERNGLPENMIECRYPVRCYQDKAVSVAIGIPYLSSISVGQETESGFPYRRIELLVDLRCDHERGVVTLDRRMASSGWMRVCDGAEGAELETFR